MKKAIFYILSISLILLMSFWIMALSHGNYELLEARSGRISMKEIDPTVIYELGGEWEYFENALFQDLYLASRGNINHVDVPHVWPNNPDYNNQPYGYSMYRLTMTNLGQESLYGIYFNNISSAFTVRVNGLTVMRSGAPAKSPENIIPYSRSDWTVFASDESGRAVIVLEIANFNHYRSGLLDEPEFGVFNAINWRSSQIELVEIGLFFAMMFIGLFFLAYYSRTKSSKLVLMWGIASIVVSFRTIFTGSQLILSLLPILNWEFVVRFEHVLTFLLLPLAGYVVYYTEYIKKNKFILFFWHLLLVIGILLPLLTPNYIFSLYRLPYNILAIISSLYFIFVIIMGIIRRVPGAIVFFIAIILILLTTHISYITSSMSHVTSIATFMFVSMVTLIIISEIAKDKSIKASLENAIIRDKLTGVFNRLFLEQHFADKLVKEKEGYNCYILFGDIDKFKSINDTYGHNVGDAVLRETGKTLNKLFTSEDRIFRFGGDEFVILTYLPENKTPEILINKIKQAFSKPFVINDTEFNVKISFGAAKYDIKNEKLYDAVMRSDELMYEEKQKRKSLGDGLSKS